MKATRRTWKLTCRFAGLGWSHIGSVGVAPRMGVWNREPRYLYVRFRRFWMRFGKPRWMR